MLEADRKPSIMSSAFEVEIVTLGPVESVSLEGATEGRPENGDAVFAPEMPNTWMSTLAVVPPVEHVIDAALRAEVVVAYHSAIHGVLGRELGV